MCLIVNKPTKEAIFTLDEFTNAATKNSHGCGVMFPVDGRVKVMKNIGVLGKQQRLFKRIDKDADVYALHVRTGTQGRNDKPNCHPYQVLDKDIHGQDLYMMHNGMMTLDEIDKNRSDTWHFVELYLKPMLENNPDLIKNYYFQEMIKDTISYGNKLLFMDGKGDVVIVNRDKGIDHNGCWLSNSYSHTPPPVPYQYNQPIGTGGGYNGDYDNDWEEDAYGRGWKKGKGWKNNYTPAKKKESIPVNDNKDTDSIPSHLYTADTCVDEMEACDFVHSEQLQRFVDKGLTYYEKTQVLSRCPDKVINMLDTVYQLYVKDAIADAKS